MARPHNSLLVVVSRSETEGACALCRSDAEACVNYLPVVSERRLRVGAKASAASLEDQNTFDWIDVFVRAVPRRADRSGSVLGRTAVAIVPAAGGRAAVW